MVAVYFAPSFRDKTIADNVLGCDMSDSLFVISNICSNNPTITTKVKLYTKGLVFLLSLHFEE